jgi:hypothetical protein
VNISVSMEKGVLSKVDPPACEGAVWVPEFGEPPDLEAFCAGARTAQDRKTARRKTVERGDHGLIGGSLWRMTCKMEAEVGETWFGAAQPSSSRARSISRIGAVAAARAWGGDQESFT